MCNKTLRGRNEAISRKDGQTRWNTAASTISNRDSYDVHAKNCDKRVKGFDKRPRERNTG